MPTCQVIKFNFFCSFLNFDQICFIYRFPVEYWQHAHHIYCIYLLYLVKINFFLSSYKPSKVAKWRVAIITLLCSCKPSYCIFALYFFTTLFCPPGTGSLSFQQSSIWPQSWQTRSKTLKTSWALRATRDRVGSLTSTVCEWHGCWRLLLLLTVNEHLWLWLIMSACPFVACSQILLSCIT